MPSFLLTAASGAPFPLVSGNFRSGMNFPFPVGEVRLKLARTASGNAYISLSGGTTVTSGGFFLSGNNSDAMVLEPGERYSIPRVAFQGSGSFNIFATCDPACSGQARLYMDPF